MLSWLASIIVQDVPAMVSLVEIWRKEHSSDLRQTELGLSKQRQNNNQRQLIFCPF